MFLDGLAAVIFLFFNINHTHPHGPHDFLPKLNWVFDYQPNHFPFCRMKNNIVGMETNMEQLLQKVFGIIFVLVTYCQMIFWGNDTYNLKIQLYWKNWIHHTKRIQYYIHSCDLIIHNFFLTLVMSIMDFQYVAIKLMVPHFRKINCN